MIVDRGTCGAPQLRRTTRTVRPLLVDQQLVDLGSSVVQSLRRGDLPELSLLQCLAHDVLQLRLGLDRRREHRVVQRIELACGDGGDGWLGAYSSQKASELRAAKIDINEHAKRGLGYEKLDQPTTELLLGVR